MHRRDFLMAMLLVPALPRRARAQRISVEDFVKLSERLTRRANLDARVATLYCNALMADPANVSLLARLVQDSGAELTPAHISLERAIIECWYTGTYTVKGERRLATHTGALMWAAMGMPAPGTCAAPFGAWSRPPRAIA